NVEKSPLAAQSKKSVYRNGYTVKEKPPSYKPYSLNTPGRRRQQAFAFGASLPPEVQPSAPLSRTQWSMLARGAKAIPLESDAKELQVQCCNAILGRTGDICLVAPTGFGKSLLWTLPLLALERGTILVVTPFTSLGGEAERQTNTLGIRSVFIHAGRKDPATLEEIARGSFRIVYVCVEMLESPTFARILHSDWYKRNLVAIFVDEAHCVHESDTWRPAYGRLHQLRVVVGEQIPLLAMSATLPSRYRQSLVTHAGLKANYTLFNIGNFRPELSTVIIHMEHDANSFKDLRFMLPRAGQSVKEIEKSIIYCDDINLLTEMLYWIRDELTELSLPTYAIDILHAGLSPEHQTRALADFKTGMTAILLSTEKLGAGLHVPMVRRVAQYLCSGLTMAKADQRRGRGARTHGTTAIGYFIAEKKFARGGQLSPEKPGHEDPGMIELLQTASCCDDVFDRYLENPPRSPSDIPPSRLCCSNCHPLLRPPREFEWIMVDPAADALRGEHQIHLNTTTKGRILVYLRSWRDVEWREQWKMRWPLYGPRSLISDNDLEAVANNAGKILSVEDLYSLTHILHWDDLSEPLFRAV
ncbi:ATP-dependent DNA helicase, partial [Daedalea quercina L-15889]